MWMCGKFVMIGARRMFFNGLVDNRTKTLMTRIVMFAFLAGEDRMLESVVMVEALLVALLMHKLARTNWRFGPYPSCSLYRRRWIVPCISC